MTGESRVAPYNLLWTHGPRAPHRRFLVCRNSLTYLTDAGVQRHPVERGQWMRWVQTPYSLFGSMISGRPETRKTGGRERTSRTLLCRPQSSCRGLEGRVGDASDPRGGPDRTRTGTGVGRRVVERDKDSSREHGEGTGQRSVVSKHSLEPARSQLVWLDRSESVTEKREGSGLDFETDSDTNTRTSTVCPSRESTLSGKGRSDQDDLPVGDGNRRPLPECSRTSQRRRYGLNLPYTRHGTLPKTGPLLPRS